MSQGYYLQALSQTLRALLPPKCRKDFDAWMQDGTLVLAPADGGRGMQLARLDYRAVFLIEELPFKELDPAVVLATVAAWLEDHDGHREQLELPDPDYDVEPIDDNTADLTISVQFSEPLNLEPDDQGPVVYGGQRYRVAPYEVWVAEQARIEVSGGGE